MKTYAFSPRLALGTTLLVSAALLAPATLSLAAPATKASTASTTFKSTQGYSLVVPATLRKVAPRTTNMDAMFLSREGTSMNIIVNKATPGETLESARKASLVLLKGSFPKFKALGQGTTTLNGVKAMTILSSFEVGTPPVPVRLLSVFALRGGKAYAISCGGPATVYPRYEGTFKKALASLRWTK